MLWFYRQRIVLTALVSSHVSCGSSPQVKTAQPVVTPSAMQLAEPSAPPREVQHTSEEFTAVASRPLRLYVLLENDIPSFDPAKDRWAFLTNLLSPLTSQGIAVTVTLVAPATMNLTLPPSLAERVQLVATPLTPVAWFAAYLADSRLSRTDEINIIAVSAADTTSPLQQKLLPFLQASRATWHAVVGQQRGTDYENRRCVIRESGAYFQALQKATGGTFHDICAAKGAALGKELAEAILQKREDFPLRHTPVLASLVRVRIDGAVVDPTQFRIDDLRQVLRFHPEFGVLPGSRIAVEYWYQ